MRYFLMFHSWDAAGNTLCIGGSVFDHFPTDKECDDAIDELAVGRTARIHMRIETE